MPTQSIDSVTSRNNTGVTIILNGLRVGRVQSFREDQANNVQVLAELGSAYMVEMQKGITVYTFQIARFLSRNDVFDALKNGAVFTLATRENITAADGTPVAESLAYFGRCMIQSISRDYTVGQAAIGVNAQVVTVGKAQ